MKKIAALLVIQIVFSLVANTQTIPQKDKVFYVLIGDYTKARENRDTVLLKKILTSDIDQLVSNGEWRTGINAAVQGMLKSSTSNPGTRSLKVEKIKRLDRSTALIDCRYEIKNPDGTKRLMWSSFVAVLEKETWKISAIRNMMPVEN